VLLCLCTEAGNRRGSLRELIFPCVAVIAVSHVGVPVPVPVRLLFKCRRYGAHAHCNTARVWAS
jgi:hypothetical protein